jgi:quinol monooxygenase YgiN
MEQKTRITATVRLRVAPQNLHQVLEILRYVMDEIRWQSGCLDCHLVRDLDHDDAITFEEVWRSQKDLEQHLQSERYRYILAAMELASHPPEVLFNTETLIGGMEVIQAARGVSS